MTNPTKRPPIVCLAALLGAAPFAHLPASARPVARAVDDCTVSFSEAAAVDALCQGSDLYVSHHPQRARFFTRFGTGRKLEWRGFSSEWARAQNTDGGFPDTNADVWMRSGKPMIVVTERGMASGVGWSESARYYFRSNGTLARLHLSRRSRAGEADSAQRLDFDGKGRLLRSSARSERTAFKNGKMQLLAGKWLQQKVVAPAAIYRSAKALPFIHLLRQSRPKR